LPLGGGREREIALPAQAGTAPSLRALTVGIGPDYFRTFQLAMRRGREFVVQDGTAGQEHVIVNERAARLYFGEQDPVGQRIAFRSPEPAGSPLGWLTIVGVAPDVRQRPRPGLEVEPIVYVPYRTAASDTAVLLLRSEADADMLAPVIRQELFSLDSNVPLYRVRTMAGVIHDGGWNGRVSNLLINVLAFIAVTLATVGLYAVTAHGVHQRTPELGLRIALGARLSHITRLILGRVMMQVGVGFLVGVVCTVIWARLFWTDAERGLVALEALAIIAVVLLVLAVPRL
jgi:hypothetical protein